jgi:hypothetical protein
MAGLRVVPPAGPPEAGEPVSMREAVMALAERVAAEEPTLVAIIYEVRGDTSVRSLPQSELVSKALVSAAYALLYPDGDPGE